MTFLLALTALPVLYVALFALAGRLRYTDPGTTDAPVNTSNRRIAVLIPGYKEDAVIVQTAAAALAQQYRSFDVVVIADSFQPETMRQLRRLPILLIPVSFERSTKAKALQVALRRLSPDRYDAFVILDADNLMAPDVLARMDRALRSGCRVVQARRVAKQPETPTALLDAASEEANNTIFRRGHRALGLSAALIGSGMAFEAGLLRRHLDRAVAVGGFDKELELNLLREGERIHYLHEALVYDEKVPTPEVFERQRTRWLSAQLTFARRHAGPALRGLLRGQLDYADKFVQMLLPPRLLLLAGLPVWAGLVLLIGGAGPAAGVMALWALLIGALWLAVPRSVRRQALRPALELGPHLAGRMLRALARHRTARNHFLHTPHGLSAPPATA